MQILGNIFYAVIFVSAIGSVFCVLSLFADHIMRCALPLWFSICDMILFTFPVLSPDVFLVSPEAQEWIPEFYTACQIWAWGCGILTVYKAVRFILAKKAVTSYMPCNIEHISSICSRCASAVGLRRTPALYWGSLDHPICVTGAVCPAIIMDKKIVEQLTDKELIAVFFHELTHIQRKHILLERLYDCVCIINWLNPLAWIARGEFSLHCETDCDDNALKLSQGRLSRADYASAILRLLELSAIQAAKPENGIGALGFFRTKRRIQRITAKNSKIRERIRTVIFAAFLALTLIFSMRFSREHFYPYPAYHTDTEYSAGYNE